MVRPDRTFKPAGPALISWDCKIRLVRTSSQCVRILMLSLFSFAIIRAFPATVQMRSPFSFVLRGISVCVCVCVCACVF